MSATAVTDELGARSFVTIAYARELIETPELWARTPRASMPATMRRSRSTPPTRTPAWSPPVRTTLAQTGPTPTTGPT